MKKLISSIMLALALSTQWLGAYEVDYLNNNAYQVPETIGNGLLQMADGSIWRVKSRDKSKIMNWTTSDILVITQGFWSYFDATEAYPFSIRNEANGDTVAAAVGLGPFADRAPMVFLIESDNQHIHLTDLSKWKISFYDEGVVKGTDYKALRKWLPGDQIVLGVNKSAGASYTGSQDFLLINVTLNGSFVRADKLY